MIAHIVGFSLFLFIEFIVFHGTILFPGLLGVASELGNVIMIVSLLSKVLGYFGSSFISVIKRFDFSRIGKVGALLFVLGVGGLLFISGLEESGFLLLVLTVVVGALIGIGDAFLNLAWAQLCISFPNRKAYLYVVGCQALASLLYLSTFFLSGIAQFVIVVVGVIVVGASFFAITFDPAPPLEAEGLRGAISELWRPIFGTSVFCFLSGLIPWISGQYDGSIEVMRIASIVSTFVMLAILSIPVLFIKQLIHLENLYKFLLPLVATGFLLLPIIGGGFGGLVNAFAGAGTYAAGIVLWCLSANSARRHRLSAATLFGISLGVTAGAGVLGRVLGYFGGRLLTEGDVTVTVISLISLYLLSMIALVIFKPQRKNEPDRVEEQEESIPVEEQKVADPEPSSACERVAEEHGLSAREAEVLALLAQGQSMVSIAQTLSVSENTARTYIKRIYRKLDVHSKQSIIDLCRE